MQAETNGKEPLDNGVVQIAGHALSLFRQSEVAKTSMKSGLVDHEPGGRPQCHHDVLILVRERGPVVLVTQIQVAVDVAAHENRDTEKRLHRGVMRGEPHTVSVLGEVCEV